MLQLKNAAIALAAAVMVSCGGAGGASDNGVTNATGNNPGGTTNPGSNTNLVSVSDNAFSPSIVNIPVGVTVSWEWSPCSAAGSYGGNGACVSHNITFDDGSNIASPVQSTGAFTRTFSVAGTYKYHCAIHGAAMSGMVIVK